MGYLHYKKYVYDGPVYEFGRCIVPRWIAYTSAPTESRAKSNLAYRYKKEHGKMPSAHIRLPGKIKTINEQQFNDGEQLIFECLADLFK